MRTLLCFHNRSHMVEVGRNYRFCCLVSCDMELHVDPHCIWFLVLALNREISQVLIIVISGPSTKNKTQGNQFSAECFLFCSMLKFTGIACLSLTEWNHAIIS